VPSKKKFSEYRKCRICRKNVKIWNLEKHFKKVHPRENNELEHIRSKSGKCIVCGKITSVESSYICEEHKVNVIPRFLVAKVLLPLRAQVDHVLRKSRDECISYFLQQFLLGLYISLGATVKDKSNENVLSLSLDAINYEQLAALSDRSLFLGYVLPRLHQAFPFIGERAYELASRDSGGGQERTRYDAEFLEVLLSEFRFFYAAYFGINGLFQIATDSIENPTSVFIVPNANREAILKMLMLRVRDSEFVHRSSLYPIIHETSEECVYDERGAFFCYSREYFLEEFDSFKSIWFEFFGSELPVSASEYIDFRGYFKWVVSPFGFTRKNKNKAYYLEDYKGLSENVVFSLLDTILVNVHLQRNFISSKMLGSKDPNYSVLDKIQRGGWGFRFPSSKGMSYYLPVIEWLNNLLSPVHVRFGRTLGVAGNFFERWIEAIMTRFSDGFLGFRFTEQFGYVPVLRRKARAQSPTGSWRILEKNRKIEIRDKNDPTKSVSKGEIDLIVYANYNIYLLELKSLNLGGKKTVKYLNKKAPKQCSKYASWIRNPENLKSLMVKHGIPEHQLNGVRILCCTNGVFDKTSIIDTETSERFAVIPLFLIFNLFAGVFTLSIRDVFPSFVGQIKNGLHTALPSLRKSYLLDNGEDMSRTANQLIQDWYRLMVFDRRLAFSRFGEVVPRPFTLAKFFLFREVYIGDTSDWILDKPLLLDKKGGYHFYVGTQIGEAGTTLVCLSCRSAVKYYYAPKEYENMEVDKILDEKKCPFCHESMRSASDKIDIVAHMSRCTLEFRERLDSQVLGDL